jgi:hypothetical protein
MNNLKIERIRKKVTAAVVEGINRLLNQQDPSADMLTTLELEAKLEAKQDLYTAMKLLAVYNNEKMVGLAVLLFLPSLSSSQEEIQIKKLIVDSEYKGDKSDIYTMFYDGIIAAVSESSIKAKYLTRVSEPGSTFDEEKYFSNREFSHQMETLRMYRLKLQ